MVSQGHNGLIHSGCKEMAVFYGQHFQIDSLNWKFYLSLFKSVKLISALIKLIGLLVDKILCEAVIT